MSCRTLLLTDQGVEIILSYISDERTRLPESRVNISKCLHQKDLYLDFTGDKGGQASATQQPVNNHVNCWEIRKGVQHTNIITC